jgi:hypothetical protein
VKAPPDRILPHGSYQESLEHALTLAHLLEHAVMFLPAGCDLWHRSGAELMQFSGWINNRLRIEG